MKVCVYASSLLALSSNPVSMLSLARSHSCLSLYPSFCYFATSDLITISLYLPPTHCPSTHLLPIYPHLCIYLQSVHLSPTHRSMHLSSVPSFIYLLSTHVPFISPSIHPFINPFLSSSHYHSSPPTIHPSTVHSYTIHLSFTRPIHHASLYPSTHNLSFIISVHSSIHLSLHPSTSFHLFIHC